MSSKRLAGVIVTDENDEPMVVLMDKTRSHYLTYSPHEDSGFIAIDREEARESQVSPEDCGQCLAWGFRGLGGDDMREDIVKQVESFDCDGHDFLLGEEHEEKGERFFDVLMTPDPQEGSR